MTNLRLLGGIQNWGDTYFTFDLEPWLKGIDKEAKELDQLVMRRIPIAWYGVASDVKLLGDFDSWTRGFSLSPAEIQDQTFTKFSAVITLLPVSSSHSYWVCFILLESFALHSKLWTWVIGR